MGKNVRLNSRRQSAVDLARETASAKATRTRSSSARKPAVDPQERIEHLEMVIATAAATAGRRRLAEIDYVPAERSSSSRRGNLQRRPHHRQQLERRRSAALFMQVIMLFVLIAAVVGWMNQKFHFWG